LKLWVALLRQLLASVLLGLSANTDVHSHVMALDHASLNLRDDGGYMAVSLSPQGLADLVLDDDGDGTISITELKAHQRQIQDALTQRIQLRDAQGVLPLQAIFVQFDAHPGLEKQHANVTAIGKFSLRPGLMPTDWSMALWPAGSAAHVLRATVTHQASDGVNLQKQSMVFSAARPSQRLFPGVGTMMADYMQLGARHILDGPDHLLFLLVVLANDWGWARLLLTLSAFTLGHATTLAFGVLGQLAVSPSLAEPAIALTIVLMAVVDERARRRSVRMPTPMRMGLVFACALVHGLGFASAFNEVSLNPATLGWSLLGFHLGIELVQFVIAACVTLLLAGLARWGHAGALPWLRPLAMGTATGLAVLWFVQRV